MRSSNIPLAVQLPRRLADLGDAIALRHGVARLGAQGFELALLDGIQVLRVLLSPLEGLFRLTVVTAVILLLPDGHNVLHHALQCGVIIPLCCR